MTDEPAREEYVPREVIDNQLLAALDDKSKVAILASEADLQMLISALQRAPIPWDRFQSAEQQRLLTALQGLGRAAFGG